MGAARGRVAYSHDADLYVASIGRSVTVRRLTRGGIRDTLLNGSLDWVYPGARIDHGFRWSPDGSEIAYLTMDERHVTNFPIVDFLTVDNRVAHERYPLAGEANPRVTLSVVTAATATSRLVYDAAARDEISPTSIGSPTASCWKRRYSTGGNARCASSCGTKRGAQLSYLNLLDLGDVQPLPFWISGSRWI